ncbi:MAG: alpha-glucoside transport system permease protein [Synergistaceae bacterium]|nr:alpha-glucoside transport system permease protein [Synergistaceae bacterium]HOA76482.1 sugar ABC transporter permease [Thermosynergistes sp.]MDI3533127.1 alpha-glucoside transport system permease protein [Synergistaceae bacterium]HPU77390.1 sugar ABC transporter permease [Thermosynergistes sp.]HPZ75824.1 sugar ABC transporter permease [Thermosynergistes sp.]
MNNKLAWLYMVPAALFLGVFLIYPTFSTIALSFFGPRSVEFVGLANYRSVLTSSAVLSALRNNLLWLAIMPTATVALGLVLAAILDRVRYEAIVKAIVFLPMSISFVGASVIWKFVYAYRPASRPQIGLLNAILARLGFEPIGWLAVRPWVNNLALITVGIWVWTGFCVVILSAAYKGVPRELVEAARIDGASEFQIFWHVILPHMRGTIAITFTTMVIYVLKIFDIVYVMTNGAFDTEVLASRMIKEMFGYWNYGSAAAIATLLLLLVIPFLTISMLRFLREER